MFPNLQEQTDEARVKRAIDRIHLCTTADDLERVWNNCQPLYEHLKAKPTKEALDLMRKLCNARIEVQIDIGDFY